MTLPEITSNLLDLARKPYSGSKPQFYVDLGDAAERLVERAIHVAIEAGALPEMHPAILQGSISGLSEELNAAANRLFEGRAAPDVLKIRFDRVIQLGQSISDACGDALEDISERTERES